MPLVVNRGPTQLTFTTCSSARSASSSVGVTRPPSSPVPCTLTHVTCSDSALAQGVRQGHRLAQAHVQALATPAGLTPCHQDSQHPQGSSPTARLHSSPTRTRRQRRSMPPCAPAPRQHTRCGCRPAPSQAPARGPQRRPHHRRPSLQTPCRMHGAHPRPEHCTPPLSHSCINGCEAAANLSSTQRLHDALLGPATHTRATPPSRVILMAIYSDATASTTKGAQEHAY